MNMTPFPLMIGENVNTRGQAVLLFVSGKASHNFANLMNNEIGQVEEKHQL